MKQSAIEILNNLFDAFFSDIWSKEEIAKYKAEFIQELLQEFQESSNTVQSKKKGGKSE